MPGALITEKAQGMDAVVHFKFTGTEAGEWNAVIRDAHCTVAQGLPKSRPSVSVVADSSDFVRVLTGELDGVQAIMDGRLKLGGDMVQARQLLQLFKLTS
jgi:putative sterol carrier protein